VQETVSDKYILDQYRINKAEGFKLLVIKYHERLYYHIRRIVILHEDADDGLQNTFMKVWNNIESFRSESSLYTWLYRISTNEALAILKKKAKIRGTDISDIEDFFNSSSEGNAWFDGDEAELKLRNAILKLPEKQKLVFNMKYFDKMQYKDMSKVLKTSVGALKASYHHAVKKIEDYLLND
jgi:RNA polymerase sigma-70 factor (ECF subfamily)